jgi:hypothetical protein
VGCCGIYKRYEASRSKGLLSIQAQAYETREMPREA